MHCRNSDIKYWVELVQGKANIEMPTSKSNTALLIAVDNGQTPLIELLVNKGNKLYSIHWYFSFCFIYKTRTVRLTGLLFWSYSVSGRPCRVPRKRAFENNCSRFYMSFLSPGRQHQSTLRHRAKSSSVIFRSVIFSHPDNFPSFSIPSDSSPSVFFVGDFQVVHFQHPSFFSRKFILQVRYLKYRLYRIKIVNHI